MVVRFNRIKFLSTLSLRRATYGRINDISRLMKISIHALLAESDPGAKSRTPDKY